MIRPAGTGRTGNRPEHTTYELTDAGADALVDRVCELVAGPVNEFEKFVVALAEIHHLDPVTATHALRRRISALECSAAELRSLSAAEPSLDYLLATTTAKLAWLRRFVESLPSPEAAT